MSIHPDPRIAVLLCTLLLMGAGCQKATDAATDAATEAAIERSSGKPVDVERHGDKVTIRGEDGEMTVQGGANLALPAGFPKDIYLPKGYVVNSVMEMGGTTMVAMKAPGEVGDLFAQAQEAMQALGWKQTVAAQNAGTEHVGKNAMLGFEKDQRNVTLSFNQSLNADGIVVSVQMR